MEPRVDLITLGVPDLAAARRFYVEGLGWQSALDIPGEIVFIQVGYGLLLGLFGADALDADIAADSPAPHAAPGLAPFTLAQVVATEPEVTETLERAQGAGGTIIKPAQFASFGGFHGYFADPSGFRWEIATNPGWSVDASGHVSIGPIA